MKEALDGEFNTKYLLGDFSQNSRSYVILLLGSGIRNSSLPMKIYPPEIRAHEGLIKHHCPLIRPYYTLVFGEGSFDGGS